MFRDGPDVSFSGSPTVSPTTAALCSSEPLPPRLPASMYFLALSQAPPELDEAIAKYEDLDIDLGRMSQSASPLLEGPGAAKIEEIEAEREKARQMILEKYDISDDDDEETWDRKIMQAAQDGAFEGLFLDAQLDEAGDAYW